MSNSSEQNPSGDVGARFRAVMDAAVDGIIIIDERGLIETANPAAEKLFGYVSDEMVGRNVSMLMPSPYREEHDGYLENYSRTKDAKVIGVGREVEGKRRDGSLFPLYLAVSEVEFDGRRIFAGFVHDLSTLKRAEDRAVQLGQILEESLNEVFIFDADTLKFLFVNHGALENMGYSLAEFRDRTPVDIKPELTQEQFEERIAPLVSGERNVVQFETVHQRRNGSTYNVLVRLHQAEWEGRNAFVATIMDVTEREAALRELADLNAQLEQRVERRTRELRDAQEQLVRREKLAALGQLSGGVAHEIRNPLGVIRNSAYFLKMSAKQLDEDMRGCIEDIEREVDTANRIISELLDFTRDPEAQTEEFPLNDALTTALRSARVPSGVQQVIDEIPADLHVRADRGQIERVLTNLIRNAWQAMKDDAELKISYELSGDVVRVFIADNGVGISRQDLDKIFEPLFTTKAKGIGLGLAVSRRYAERNGGSLTVESEEGVGTTFCLAVRSGGETSE